MTTLSDTYTAILNFHNTNGYHPDTIHLTHEQLAYLISTVPTTVDVNNVTQCKLYGCNISISDTFAVSGTQPTYA